MYSRLSRYSKYNKRKRQIVQVIVMFITGFVGITSVSSVNTASILTMSEVRDTESKVAITPISVDLRIDEAITGDSLTEEIALITTTNSARETVVVSHHNQVSQPQAVTAYPTVLANGNTAGAIGSEAAAQMAARTGVPQATWEYIIARESNGNPNAANASGASGLFQTMPGWGSTATVEDQIDAAVNAYNNQGLAAWGM